MKAFTANSWYFFITIFLYYFFQTITQNVFVFKVRFNQNKNKMQLMHCYWNQNRI